MQHDVIPEWIKRRVADATRSISTKVVSFNRAQNVNCTMTLKLVSSLKIISINFLLNTDRTWRICQLCQSDSIGDEFHYLFIRAKFEKERNILINIGLQFKLCS